MDGGCGMVDGVGDGVCDGVGDVVCMWWWGDVVCDGVDGSVSGGEDSDKVEWLILSCLGVLVTDRRTDGQTN